MAGHLRVAAHSRLLQERIRLVRTRRRRRRQGAQSVPRGSSAGAARAAVLAVTPTQAAAHPLLARTRDDLAGVAALTLPDLREPVSGRAGRIAVVAHVYYTDLWPELAQRIERIPAPVDLVVTLVRGHSEYVADAIVAQFPDARLELVPNRGFDLWPFVHVLQLGLIGDHDAVLKLHTKASVHRVDGPAWRTSIIDSLCASPYRIEQILQLLAQDSRVGMIAPAGGVLGREFWGSNAMLVDALAIRAGVAVDPERTWFAGGSMFWARPEPLQRLRRLPLTIEDFEPEVTSRDGTTAHALERFLGALVIAGDQEVIGADEVASRLFARSPWLRPSQGRSPRLRGRG